MSSKKQMGYSFFHYYIFLHRHLNVAPSWKKVYGRPWATEPFIALFNRVIRPRFHFDQDPHIVNFIRGV